MSIPEVPTHTKPRGWNYSYKRIGFYFKNNLCGTYLQLTTKFNDISYNVSAYLTFRHLLYYIIFVAKCGFSPCRYAVLCDVTKTLFLFQNNFGNYILEKNISLYPSGSLIANSRLPHGQLVGSLEVVIFFSFNF